MKAKNLIVTALVAIAAGVGLIIANKSINSNGVVVAGGIIFIIAGILNFFVLYSERKRQNYGPLASTFSTIGNVGALVLGICMLIFQPTFVVLVPYIFGIIVAFLACYQFFVLAVGARPATLPAWFYLVPIVLIGGSIFIFFLKPEEDDHLIILISGIALALFGLFTIIEGSMIPHMREKATGAHAEEKSAAKPTPLDESAEKDAKDTTDDSPKQA